MQKHKNGGLIKTVPFLVPHFLSLFDFHQVTSIIVESYAPLLLSKLEINALYIDFQYLFYGK